MFIVGCNQRDIQLHELQKDVSYDMLRTKSSQARFTLNQIFSAMHMGMSGAGATNFSRLSTPKPINDTATLSEATIWKIARDNEFNYLLSNNSWELTKLPKGRKAIENKWEMRKTFNSNGYFDSARLVCKGSSLLISMKRFLRWLELKLFAS